MDDRRGPIACLQPATMKLSIKRTDAAMPPPAVTENPRVEIWRDIRGSISAYAEVLDDQHWMHLPGLASFRFSSFGGEISATVHRAVREDVVLDAYHRKILPMALQVRGREVLHASAVRSSNGVTALCGFAETGKSTIAYGLSRRGYRLWADDTVVFEISGGGGLAISLPFDMRLRPPSAALFDVDATPRPVANPDRTSPTSETVPLVAVCVLRRAHGPAPPVTVRSLSSGHALEAVLKHAWCFVPLEIGRKRLMISHYLELIAKVPVFDVCFQAGLGNLPTILDTIQELIATGSPKT
jgi:hypothetical protein